MHQARERKSHPCDKRHLCRYNRQPWRQGQKWMLIVLSGKRETTLQKCASFVLTRNPVHFVTGRNLMICTTP